MNFKKIILLVLIFINLAFFIRWGIYSIYLYLVPVFLLILLYFRSLNNFKFAAIVFTFLSLFTALITYLIGGITCLLICNHNLIANILSLIYLLLPLPMFINREKKLNFLLSICLLFTGLFLGGMFLFAF